MSVAFRFHGPTDITPADAARRLSKRKFKNAAEPILLGADNTSLADAGGRRPIECYSDFAGASCMTLTRKEVDLIALANPGIRPPLALEEIHPWISGVSYRENSGKNFENLNAIVGRYSRHLVTAATYCDEKWNKVCNSTRRKTNLDIRFFNAWHLPVQDTYILEENRPHRSVIALDFNAMYPFCMQHKFPDPSKMRHIVYNREIAADEALPAGLYRCQLRGPPSEFIRKYNPFRTFFAGRYLRSALSESLSVDLNEFEVNFYKRHFREVHITDAVVSDRCVSHPLARDARRSFARRLHYIANGNKPLANREKFLSTLLSSCTHRPSRSRRNFELLEDAEDYLRKNFGILVKADDPAGLSARWLRGKKTFVVTETADSLQCEIPDVFNGSACFAFNQRIVARSRIILLEMMEKLYQSIPDVELCYSNVDSIHFSLPSSRLNSVMSILRLGESKRMGDYKIEAIARGGLWLEPGRYWIYSDKIIKFRNRSIRHKGLAFTDHSINVVNRKIGDLHIPIKMTIGMDRSMTDLRSIQLDPATGLERQQLVEKKRMTSNADILSAFERNRKQSIPRRMQAFRRLASYFGNVETRCLETQQNSQKPLSRRDPSIEGVFGEHFPQEKKQIL